MRNYVIALIEDPMLNYLTMLTKHVSTYTYITTCDTCKISISSLHLYIGIVM